MKIASQNYQPFEAVSIGESEGSLHIHINRGSVHGFFRPIDCVPVSGASEEIIYGAAETHILTEENSIAYARVTLRRTNSIGPDFGENDETKLFAYPTEAFLEVDSEVPEPESDLPLETFYEICRWEDGVLKQTVGSDIWCGHVIKGSVSSSDSSSNSSDSDSSSSDSSSGGGGGDSDSSSGP